MQRSAKKRAIASDRPLEGVQKLSYLFLITFLGGVTLF